MIEGILLNHHESLVKAGAFDSIDSNRSKLFGNIPKVLEELDQARQNANQGSLFDLFGSEDESQDSGLPRFELDEYPAWTLKDGLQMEKQALGYYFSASLFDEYQDIVRKLGITPLSHYSIDNEDMQDLINGRNNRREKVLICGVINYMGSRPLKKGGKMSFINIEDDVGSLEFVVFNEEFEKYKPLFKMDEFIFVTGELMYDAFRNQIKVTAKHISTLDEILLEQINNVMLTVNHEIKPEYFQQFLSDNGVAKVSLNYNNMHAKCKINLGAEYKFVVNYDNLCRLNQLVGKHNWSIN